MHPLRRLILSHRRLAALVVVLALAMKIAMPAGFMPTIGDGRILVSICAGTGPMTMAIAIPGMAQDAADKGDRHGKADQPCAFAGLAAPALAGADALLLAAAMLFVLALAIRAPLVPAAVAPPHLRPPLRGPPARS